MEYENLVLKHALLSKQFFQSVSYLRPDMFSDKFIQGAWRVIKKVYEKTSQLDFIELSNALAIDPAALYDFTEIPGVQSQAGLAASKIFKKYSVVNVHNKLLNMLAKPELTEADLERAQDFIRESLYTVSARRIKTLKEIGREAMSFVQRQMKTGIEFPWMSKKLNECTGGLLRSEITTLAALPGHGKSTFAVQQSLLWAMAGADVALFSLEMKGSALLLKLASGLTKIPYERIFLGKLSHDETVYLDGVMLEIADQAKSLTVVDDLFSIDEIESYVYQHKPSVVVIDWIQMIDTSADAVRTYAIGDILKTIKQFSQRLDIATLIVAQHKRDFEMRSRERLLRHADSFILPLDSDISDSSAVEKVSAAIIHLFDREKILRTGCPEELRGILDFIVTKERYLHPGFTKMRKQPDLTFKEIED